ncbi:heavy-metal-associated domain-containing protein [Noviherbaspirillum denitrificans]|uniref:Copper-binding protein n=1 Tax=Noviherbaspirillum denitrificans TaxID=1968433 RepID=A0A254TPQ8_9BURK|nr:heavy-metal-associated domain-containing protein [Noviherbaspirillum denitrificans]OWW22633.1 copper-binding protein [Noviherbaspirillum denitrificans]
MFAIQVEKMSCGGCAARVTKAIQAQDASAKVDVDLRSKTVRVESNLDAEALVQAVTAAGYPAKVSVDA